MGFFFKGGAEGMSKGIDFSSNENIAIESRVIGNEETAYINDGFDMLTKGSWSDKELAGFDLKGELFDKKTHKVGLFTTIDGQKKLVGFAGAGPLGTPNFNGTEEYPKDGNDVWCGYFVIHPDFRNRLDVMQHLKSLHDAVLGAAIVMTSESRGRILACTERKFIQLALPKLGWTPRGETPVVDKNGKLIDQTNVFEYIIQNRNVPIT